VGGVAKKGWPGLWDSSEPMGVRLIEREKPVYIRADFAALEARVVSMWSSQILAKCGACGDYFLRQCLVRHCREKGDANHLALEVMGS
jgi:hypothetical protein